MLRKGGACMQEPVCQCAAGGCEEQCGSVGVEGGTPERNAGGSVLPVVVMWSA